MIGSNSLVPRIVALGVVAALLGGCNTLQRLKTIGEAPPMSPIVNPVQQPEYQPVVLPMPRPESSVHQPNSLWRAGARAFFKDQRAARVGDILTVNITIEDEATIDNETTRSRQNTEDANLTRFLGYEGSLGAVLPQSIDPTNLVDAASNSSSTGRGSVNRSESIKLNVAAIITQVLPNGNLVLTGSQEVRVNYEVRVLTVSGVVRPEDISAVNTINHTQIAEARIAYGGRGQITDVQQPRYGQQLYDVIFPF